MPNSKSNRRGGCEEKNRRGKLTKKSSSFHGGVPVTVQELRRPRTSPDLISGRKDTWLAPEGPRQLTKLLLNVTILGSVGAVQVIVSPESSVGELITCSVRQYVKEGRRPILPTADPAGFDLHYSQFSLESLDREEKVRELGSRNFFLCPKKRGTESGGGGVKTSSLACNKEAEKASKTVSVSWLKFMDFIL